MLPHSSSICDFYHFDDTKDNQRFFLIARPLWVVLKDVVCLPSPHLLSLSLFLSSPLLLPSHLHSTHAPLLCVLLLHLCSDYSSIGSHADVAIGRYADLAIDTHKRPHGSLQGYSELACNVISLSLRLLAEPKWSFLPVYWHKKCKSWHCGNKKNWDLILALFISK